MIFAVYNTDVLVSSDDEGQTWSKFPLDKTTLPLVARALNKYREEAAREIDQELASLLEVEADAS